jgi:hypothetical protein
MGRRGKLELEVKVSRRERRNGIRNGEGKEGKAKWEKLEGDERDKVLEEKWELGMGMRRKGKEVEVGSGMEWEGEGKRCVGMESGEEGMGMGKLGMVGKWELDGCSDTLPMPKRQ